MGLFLGKRSHNSFLYLTVREANMLMVSMVMVMTKHIGGVMNGLLNRNLVLDLGG